MLLIASFPYYLKVLLFFSLHSFRLFILSHQEYSVYFDLVRDCYEAYALYMFFNLLVAFINTNELEEVQAEETRKEVEAQQEMEAGLQQRTEETGLLEQQTKVNRTLSINVEDNDTSEYDRVIAILAAKPRSGHPVFIIIILSFTFNILQCVCSGLLVASPSFNQEELSCDGAKDVFW